MDNLSIAIITMEAHIACSNERLRQAWDIIHAKLVEENGSSHNKESAPCYYCEGDKESHLRACGNTCCPNCKRHL